MKSRKLKIAVLAVAIILAVSMVGVTFAVWDITSANKDFSITVGNNLDFKIKNQTNDGNLKDFAPIATGDVTSAVVSAKLASFDVVSATTGTDSELKLSYTDVTATYKVEAGDIDLSAYVDLYILNETAYAAFNDGDAIPAGATLMSASTTIEHSVAGVKQGVVIIWKTDVLDNSFADNTKMIEDIANKAIKVTLNFSVAIVNA